MNKRTRIAIYVRVSTAEQAKEGYSIGEQTERLTMYAKAHGWSVSKVYTDAGQSGATTNRPALQQMLSDIHDGLIDKVLVYKLDRLSRSQKDTLSLIEDEFMPNGTDFVSISENFDTGTPFGMAMIGILAVFAQLEREQIRERLSMGMTARIKEGKWRGVAPPFGYTYDGEKLVVHDYEAMIIKFVFDEFTSGRPLRRISDDMDAKGYAFRNGSTSISEIKYVVANKTYCGYLRHNDEWIQGMHEAIISEDQYEKAKKILDENRKRYFRHNFRINNTTASTALGGIVYCGQCGGKFVKRHVGHAPNLKYQYICHSRAKMSKVMIKDPNCMNKYYAVDDLDQVIFTEIKKLALDPDYIKTLHQPKVDTDKQIEALEGQVKQISTQISRLMDLYSLGRYSLEDLDTKTAALHDQRTKLQAEIDRIQSGRKILPEATVKDLAGSFEAVLDHGDLSDKRRIITALIDRIIVDGDDITIHWNF